MQKIIIGICINLLCLACKTGNKKLIIYPVSPYVFEDTVRPNATANLEYRRVEYYVVERYEGDTAQLRACFNNLIDSTLKEKNKLYSFFAIHVYKSSSNTYKEQTDDIDGKYAYKHEKDKIAEIEWFDNAPYYFFDKNGKILNKSPGKLIIKDVDLKSEDTLNVHNEK
ncbi:hypothetical protein ACI6Q2_22085 [Chitinophagaceae bacterium LWZ2-11]